MRGAFLLFFHVELGEWGLGSWKLAGLTFLWRRSFSRTCHLESSEIDDRDREQARHNFSGEATRGCGAKLFEELIETKLRRTANTTKYAFGEAFFLGPIRLPRESR